VPGGFIALIIEFVVMPVFGFKDVGFELKTENLGALNFHRVTPDYAARIEKADVQHDLPPDAFLSLLIVILGSKQDGRAILVEDAYALSASEREAFVQAFLNEHGEYYRERILEERTSDLGEKVTRSFLGDRIVNPRHDGEEPAAYLTRLYRDFASGVVTPEVRRVGVAPPAVVVERNDAFADSLLKNAALSESLGKSLAQMKMMEHREPDSLLAAAMTETEIPTAIPEAAGPLEARPIESIVSESIASPAPLAAPTLSVLPSEESFPPLNFTQGESDFSRRIEEPTLGVEHSPLLDVPEPDAKQTLDMMRGMHDAVLQNLQQVSETAEQNALAARRARRLAVLALLFALIVPGGLMGYLALWSSHP
jgi:hypothetical protein